ncbi:histidine kinase, partial [Micromonospora harpali]
GGETELPVRPRRPAGQSALDGPTVPTGLPITTPRPAGGGAAPGSTVERPEPAERPDGTTTDGETAPDAPAPAPAPAPVQRTGTGLPVRVRQANIVPELREDPAAQPDEEEDTVRVPEQVLKMMSSYQRGTRRGRTDAARLLGGAGGAEPTGGSGDDADGHEAT